MARGWHRTDTLAGPPSVGPRFVEDHAGWSAGWFDPPFRPELRYVDQVYGICFDDNDQILLICTDDEHGRPYWNLPGGGLEPGETLEECLAREVAEEGCATVLESSYIGCQRVDEKEAARSCYQTRFWARVRLDPWAPMHETYDRALVRPDEFLARLAWGDARTAAVILDEGRKADRRVRAQNG